MRIIERQCGDVVVLDLRGSLAGSKAVEVLDAAVRRHCGGGQRCVVADLGNLRSVDAPGLGALVDAHLAVRENGGVLKLARVARRINDLTVITRLLTVFETCDSVQEAVVGYRDHAHVHSPQPSLMSVGAIHRFLRGV